MNRDSIPGISRGVLPSTKRPYGTGGPRSSFAYFFSGYIKDAAGIPRLPTAGPELGGRTRAATTTLTLAMLTNERIEREYRYMQGATRSACSEPL
jgi:hypothetical protein